MPHNTRVAVAGRPAPETEIVRSFGGGGRMTTLKTIKKNFSSNKIYPLTFLNLARGRFFVSRTRTLLLNRSLRPLSLFHRSLCNPLTNEMVVRVATSAVLHSPSGDEVWSADESNNSISQDNMSQGRRKRRRLNFPDVVEVDDDDLSYDEGERLTDSAGPVIQNLRVFNRDDYEEAEICAKLDQIVKPSIHLRIVSRSHTTLLTRLYRANGNERSSGLITVTVTQERNSAVEGFNINNLFVVASDGTKHLKTGIKADIVDGMHRFAALTSLKQEGGHDWVNQPILLIYVKKKRGEDLSKTEILHLSSAKNKVSGAVKSDSDFIEYVRYGISFAEAFMTDHEVQRSEIVINQLAREMIDGTTRKYARLVKAMMKFPEAIDRLENFFNGNVPERLKGRLGITHISATFFQEEPQDVEECWLVLESISRLVFEGQVDGLGAPSRRRRFSGSEFYAQVTEVLDVLRKCYEDYKEEGETFLKREVYFTRTKTESIRENFFTSMLTMQRTDSSGRNRAAVALEKRIRNMYGEPEPPLTTTSRKGKKQTTLMDTIVETRGHKEARRRREARLRGEEEHVVLEAPPSNSRERRKLRSVQLPPQLKPFHRPAPPRKPPTTTRLMPV